MICQVRRQRHSGVSKSKADPIVATICVLILAGVLTAGLWPFHAPKNQVFWLRSGNGIRLGRHGTLLSAKPFALDRPSELSGNSIEIWLQPDSRTYSGTILAYYNSDTRQQFSLHQSKENLGLQTDLESATTSDRTRVAYVPDVFRDRTRIFITITLGPQGTASYINGTVTKVFPIFRPGARAFSGQLVLGTSPVENASWSGLWLGLATYNRELTPAQVRRHYLSWTSQGRPELREDDRATAIYTLYERTGSVVHNTMRDQLIQNQVGSEIDLCIPEKYTILEEKFLEPAWKEFHWGWGYWKNVLINIAGFIPFGFFFYAYLSSTPKLKQLVLLALILGGTISFTIEVLQSFLPTRDSGTTDLITNTLGTYVGALLYRWKPTLIARTLKGLPFVERSAHPSTSTVSNTRQ